MSEHAAIEATLHAVASALDERDWAALGAAFTEDAHGYGADGRAAIVARVREHLGGCGPSQHLLGNVRVTVDGDTARSRAYGRVFHVGVDDPRAFYECMGEYHDRWLRTPEGWRLIRRRFVISIERGDRGVLRPG
ncbi:nuclear transport factor 2 family protein [Blastococcus sp. BMG 814]|uniref:Nuclear transport factor 2 family protein n=1 Tax=Blastococcus carthaginiensis TaxID=3050034 RepID=A0ABT9I8M1_9ACTN|nr:nuclear transport factor 2 family protein [Blastococcus carthaginiensis]MDP5181919.1 nuclear transport factor 2 family protein [Blastococcus carthaginiensis]